MNRSQTEAKKIVNKTIVEVWTTWNFSPRDMIEILISICGDIAVSEDDITLKPIEEILNGETKR